MKKLTILRHAKADLPEKYPSDFVRPLTKRGEKDAEQIAGFLKALQPRVDWVISSPALRAEQTAKIIAKRLPGSVPVMYPAELYEADAGLLLSLLKEVPPEQEHALLIGHNPSLESLVAGLCTGSPGNLEIRLATAGLVHLDLEIMRWDQVRWGAGVMQILLHPRMLR